MSGSRNPNNHSPAAEGSLQVHPALAGLNAAAGHLANIPAAAANQQKYSLLLATIDEIGKQIRPAHTGNKNATEQMKRHIAFAKLLIRELIGQSDMNLSNLNARERKEVGFSSSSPAGSSGGGMKRKNPPGGYNSHSGSMRQN